MRRSTAPFHIDRSGYHLALDAVPAWVCGQCGEPYFEEREVDAIQGATRALDEQTRQLRQMLRSSDMARVAAGGTVE